VWSSLVILAACGDGDRSDQRSFSLDDAARLRQPVHSSIAPDGGRLSYILGDTLYVRTLDAGSSPPRPVLSGVASESSYALPFLAWAPTGTHLVVRAGVEGPGEADSRQGTPFLVDLEDPLSTRALLPDSLRRRISTFRTFLTPRPTWSPDGARLAFVGWDLGSTDNLATVFIWDLHSSELARVAVDGEDKLGLAWSPDGRWLTYTTGSFRGSEGTVRILDASDLETPVAMFGGGASLYRTPRWSPDGRTLMVTDLQARPTLLDVSRDGSMTERPSTLPARTYAGFMDDGTALLATVTSGMNSSLARVDLDTGVEHLLTSGDSLYRAIGVAKGERGDLAIFSLESGDTPLDVWSAPLLPGGELGPRSRLTSTNPWLDSVRLGTSRVHRWTASNGEELSAQIFEPDGPGPHPMVVIPYGSYVNEFPKAEYFLTYGVHALVASGFVVARPNTRGIASTQQSDGRYGEVQLEDTVSLIGSLVAAGLVDDVRVALLGHSHGATMVYYYLSHSDRFAGGIAVNGAADWELQAGLARMAGLPAGMGGTPEELPEKYREFSPLANARTVTAPILAVSGSLDTQVPEINSASMVDTLRAVGKEIRWLSFPDEGHLIENPENVRRFWDEALSFLRQVVQ
jgi:dipeptidyl aminopeptidase/acylaminoacyl peptidase